MAMEDTLCIGDFPIEIPISGGFDRPCPWERPASPALSLPTSKPQKNGIWCTGQHALVAFLARQEPGNKLKTIFSKKLFQKRMSWHTYWSYWMLSRARLNRCRPPLLNYSNLLCACCHRWFKESEKSNLLAAAVWNFCEDDPSCVANLQASHPSPFIMSDEKQCGWP